MIFETLYQSAKKNELILVDGGLCRWHMRKDGQITILEIISVVPGIGSKMLGILQKMQPQSIFLKCPADLPSNDWWLKKGFTQEGQEITRSGRKMNRWRLTLSIVHRATKNLQK